jgi:hypothetical protein
VLKSDEDEGPVSSGLHSFVPVWNPIVPEAHSRRRSIGGTAKILVLGANEAQLQWVQKCYPAACLLGLAAGAGIADIQAALKEMEESAFEYLLWIAPDVACAAGPCSQAEEVKAEADELIAQQEAGVVAVFRTIKALLGLGYGDRELRWTIITGRTQQVKKGERIQPAHAGIVGLVGSLAKEYPHWDVSVQDVDDLGQVSAEESLSLSGDRDGNVLAWRSGEWFQQEFAQIGEMPQSLAGGYRQQGVYVVIGGGLEPVHDGALPGEAGVDRAACL